MILTFTGSQRKRHLPASVGASSLTDSPVTMLGGSKFTVLALSSSSSTS